MLNGALVRTRHLVILAVLGLLSGCGLASAAGVQADEVVRLVIDYGDGVEKHFNQLPWVEDMTVLDVLNEASRHPRGIAFVFRGKGATAFLHELDGVKNEGGDGLNWMFTVNDQLGEQSFAVTPVQAEDTVLWKFRSFP